MSLQDGTSKMSKSDPNDGSRINLMDDADTIKRKIKRCKTDDSMGLEWDNPARPECTNLLNIYQVPHFAPIGVTDVRLTPRFAITGGHGDDARRSARRRRRTFVGRLQAPSRGRRGRSPRAHSDAVSAPPSRARALSD